MPRPCQRRRERTAAQQKNRPNPKPAGPPPIQHKARQKAIHNARHGRGGRGGGAARGGRQSRNQRSGTGTPNGEQDFISFASAGNNFHVLNGDSRTGRQQEDGSLEDGELIIDDGSDEADSEDLDMYNAEDMMINVQVDQVHNRSGKGKRAEVMFPIMEAISIYRTLYQAGFPLSKVRSDRFEIEEEAVLGTQVVIQNGAGVVGQYERIAFRKDTAEDTVVNSPDPARDYVFDFGVHKGQKFNDVPENYLKTIAGNPYLLDNHSSIKPAFDYHRPGMRRTVPTEAQRLAHETTQVAAAAKTKGKAKAKPTPKSEPSGNARNKAIKKSWEDFTFPSNSANAEKRLDQVDENYLKTIEGMPHVLKKWRGLQEALEDFNEKTGRKGRVVKSKMRIEVH